MNQAQQVLDNTCTMYTYAYMYNIKAHLKVNWMAVKPSLNGRRTT